MDHTATNLIQHFGYAGLGLGVLISTLGLFSSEVFLLLAGVALRQGRLSWVGVIIVALVGQMAGALISHAIGEYGGVPLVERYGRYVLLSKRDLSRAHRWFERHGRTATVLAYSLPVLRGYAGYAAGIAEQPRGPFAASALVGSIIWSVLLIGLGYGLAAHLGTIERIIRPISLILIVLIVLAVGWFIRHRWKEARG